MDSNKIVWREGMFLSPQHFQHQERYMVSFTRQYITQITQQSYGLTQLEFDRSMLKMGKIVVHRAAGIFPDGTPFSFEKGLILDVPLNTNNKKVYLALPVVRLGTVDVGQENRFRHHSIEHAFFDTTREHSDSVMLELAMLNIELKLEDEELTDYTLLSIAEIAEHKSDGTVVLNQAFIPHCLHFGVSHYLTDSLTDAFAKMQYRARTIASRLKVESQTKSYQALMRDHLWLQLLGQWMPIIEQWNQATTLRTQDLYLACVSLVGQIQGLEGKMPSSFAVWNQNKLYHIFSAIFSELLMYLRDVQMDNVTTLEWDMQLFASRRLLRTLLKDRTLLQKGQFILVASSSIGSSRLSVEFPKAIKLAGNSDIAGLVRNGLSGVPLSHLPYAPSELKSRQDAAYFEVDTKSDLWQALMKKGEAIALHIDERIVDINVEFHVIR